MTAPDPPADILRRRPNLFVLPKDTVLYRFFNNAYEPVFYDRGLDGRLNAPDGSYGVLYAASSTNGAFAETFLRQPARRIIDIDTVNKKGVVRLSATRPMSFCALTGPGLVRLGATAEVTHGGVPYDVPQTWSKAIHQHPSNVDGIVYKARHDDVEDCFAVFDRASAALAERDRDVHLDASWFWDLAAIYDVGIAP